MSKKRHVPLRTCMGCRMRRKKEEMVRLTKGQEGVFIADEKMPHPGRGFYICPDIRCLAMAKKKNRGVGFLGTMDFRPPSAEGFYKEEKGFR